MTGVLSDLPLFYTVQSEPCRCGSASTVHTYFAGNNRHRGFAAITEDIGRLLEVNPRDSDG